MKLFSNARNRNGAALVIVLAILVICLGLIVAFLSRSGSEVKASVQEQMGGLANSLERTAISVVTTQINLAANQGSDTTWASQPGAVRSFQTDGTLSRIYKLFSSETMIADSFNLDLDLPPADWRDRSAVWVDLNEPLGGVYPILDPSTFGTIVGLPVPSNYPAGVTGAQMPVRWLYVMEDGQIVAPTGGDTSVTISEASPTNPIVGRIAFWTDDESSKVNINTASAGEYWDTPRSGTEEERTLAGDQPRQREYPKYPGHPATVSLRPLLPGLTDEEIYAIAPGVVSGNNTAEVGSDGVLIPDDDRLYASYDEIYLTASRDVRPVDLEVLRNARFVLTAHSRAPEVNLFNMPRVSMWPVRENLLPNDRVSVYDRLLAFAATLDGEPYYFQRKDATSATSDISITRNEQLLAYLEYLAGRPIPGFGGSFQAKYGPDKSQIITEVFDFIRSTNLEDGSLGDVTKSYTGVLSNEAGFGQVAPSRRTFNGVETQGVGRFPAISEVGLQFIATADPSIPDSNNPATNRTLGAALPANQRQLEAIFLIETFIPAVCFPRIIPNFTIRVEGLNNLGIAGVGAIGFPADGKVEIAFGGGSVTHGRNWGGTLSFRLPLHATGLPERPPMPADAPFANQQGIYPFVSNPFTVSTSSGSMTLQGGTVIVKLYAGTNIDTSVAVPISTISATFPGWQMPIPTVVQDDPRLWTFSRDGVRGNAPGRLARSSANPDVALNNLIRPGSDVVRTMVPVHSDYRLLAAASETGTDVFVEHPSTAPGVAIAHAFSEGARSSYFPAPGNFQSSLASPTLTYSNLYHPDYPVGDSRSQDGDWDSSFNYMVDGAYVNLPDEGNIIGLSAGQTPYFDQNFSYLGPGTTYFSPNRKVPSPGILGSLPTGVKAGVPWRTLLFRPQPTHPAASTTIPDHLILDLFWMPVVEPYAISDPFSTAGKINMNYDILPFRYLTRSSALYAVLANEKVGAIPNADGMTYKGGVSPANENIRLAIDIPATLKQFSQRFSSGEIFRSATEICDIHMVTQGQTVGGMATFWEAHALTGDNLRERIYATTYPKLTTRSNTFTIHYRVQALRAPKSGAGNTFNDKSHDMGAQRRGSIMIERFLDPGAAIPDYAGIASSNPGSLSTSPKIDQFYKWRTVETRRFTGP